MRYERKFELKRGYRNVFYNFLRCNFFKEIYYERKINSVYYDTYNYDLYSDSINGLSTRNKIRARFYESDYLSEVKLEIKKKEEYLNNKQYPLLVCKENGKLLPLKFNNKLEHNLDIKIPAHIAFIYKPKIMVSYKRRYFLFKDRQLRLTVDYDIEFMKTNLHLKNIYIENKRSFNRDVIEMKYSDSYEINKNLIKSICNNFEIQLSRFSKYCSGIEMMNLI